jgi:hypothetical protein
MEIQYSQLNINHLNDTPSTKASGGRIFSGVFNKDVKVPLQEAELVGTSSSNSESRGWSLWHQSEGGAVAREGCWSLRHQFKGGWCCRMIWNSCTEWHFEVVPLM